MIIKLEKVISCSSENPSYPASNLLEYRTTSNSSWRCAKPGESLATVIFQLAESSCITGVEIGNYRSCIVIVTASTTAEPDNWIPIINHQFLTHDEAANGKFKDQVQIFTKKDLNPEILKTKFDRVKVTCMQSANPREVFGLSFLVLRTEIVVDMGLDVFGRFKMKDSNEEKDLSADKFKDTYLKLFGNKKPGSYKDELKDKMKENGLNNFAKRQEEEREHKTKPLLEKLEAGKADEVFGKAKDSPNSKPVARTPFGDVIPSTSKTKEDKNESNKLKNGRKRSLSPDASQEAATAISKKAKCNKCEAISSDKICEVCNKLPPQKAPEMKKIESKKAGEVPPKKRTQRKKFEELLEGVSFSLSGYVNPQRDEIRRKALKMGAKYIADPNTTDKLCTHLICAFKNTPKSQQLKGHSKIVSHKFIEDCFDKKRRIPWRRFALDKKEREESDSEEEFAGIGKFIPSEDEENDDTDEDFKPYDEETDDEDSDSNY
ncbi:DNA repair protein XRCC1 [Belonocnema kinseyi]|uniref:DNA repair protein XRCC1 n=1 Tax=Belonocnema kinseyi TaxID=2817044 RepID=UPI00143DC484|nr:DNA repair protein XRCC1 [Belonocnema kinseyi]XP_033208850.1 DNA repair protein XRCC1 [Belonocnema kinseyi]XP_033208851.1 DNA repair protein XRCC1 [Belonocnema kinseyi]